jgi:hypothetical protein
MSEIFYVCDENPHMVGDENCRECWQGFPREHSCGGLAHAEFYEEHEDSVDLVYRCDKCDSNKIED